MSLLPYLLDDSPFFRPSRLLDQHFGLALDPEDVIQTLAMPNYVSRSPAGYLRNWKSSGQDVGSVITSDKDKFQANLDVQQFKPNEISVKVTGENTITIEGKHEERPDEHGHIYRHFVRRYVLPKTCDVGRVESRLSSDGVLTITAPKIDDQAIEHKTIPIIRSGEPVKQVEGKK
ncbi:hypothetical protein NQ317_004171 [Molorchus minor]|uniref:SHSP domain-containing protein n=1 Tax=Molorchus minor TaxID=1323400 RepID=A0ABQ9JU40_9CUCU|nr:hypothetical protein NQ317_004171 [Molorchus minor]